MMAIVGEIQGGQVVSVRDCVSWRREQRWEISSMGLAGHRDENTRAAAGGTAS